MEAHEVMWLTPKNVLQCTLRAGWAMNNVLLMPRCSRFFSTPPSAVLQAREVVVANLVLLASGGRGQM